MLWKDPDVGEAVVLCVVCVLVAICSVVPVCCAVCCCSVAVRCTVTVCCGGCGSVVVVGARGGAGVVVGSSLLPREVVGVVATAGDTATQTVGCLDVDVHGVSTNPVVALVVETYLVEAVEAEKVEDPVAKAQAG